MKVKKLLFIGIIIFLGSLSQAFAQDTISVELGDKAIILIVTEGKEGLQRIKELDLNQLIRDVTAQLDTNQTSEEKEVKIYEMEYDPNTKTLKLVEVDEDEEYSSNSYFEGPYVSFTDVSFGGKSRTFWAVEFGLNNFLEDGKFPDAQGAPYGLRTAASRYFATGLYNRSPIGGPKTPFSIQFGIEFSWYNFMFQNDNYIVNTEDGVEFRDYEADFGQALQKTKLVVPYVNIPLMLNLRFRNRRGRRTFNFGVGGYVGYRLGGHSAIKFNGDKDRDRDNFFLNNWRYGVETQIGFRHFLLFGKYDLNELFVAGKGPKLNAFAFGIRI